MARATSPGSSWPPANTIALKSPSVIRVRAARLVKIPPIVTDIQPLPQTSVVAVGGCRHGLRLLDAVDEDAIDEFIVEAHETSYPRRLEHRVRVVPDHVFAALPSDGY